MKNNIIILRLRLAPVFLFFSFMDSNAQDGFGIWSGTISYHIKFTALLHNYERQIDIETS